MNDNVRHARRRRWAGDLLVIVVTAVYVLLVPIVLATVFGSPLPSAWTSDQLLAMRGLLDLLLVLAWIAWAVQAANLARAFARHVRHGLDPARPMSLTEQWAVRFAGACLVIATLLGVGATASSAAPVRPPVTHASVVTAPVPVVPTAVPPAAPQPPVATDQTYTVTAGDTLWSIAERLYGSGTRFPLIAAANLGHVMDDGRVFDTESLIFPGWVLTIPPPPNSAASPPAQAPAPVPAPAPLSSPAPSDPTGDHPQSSSDRSGHHDQHHSTERQHPSHIAASDHGGRYHLDLPAEGLLAAGVLGSAVLAWRVARNRRVTRISRQPGQVGPPLKPNSQSASSAIAPFGDLPALEMLALGLSHLTRAINDEQAAAPSVRLIRVGADGLELLLTRPEPNAPGAFRSFPGDGGEDGWSWVLDATEDVRSLDGVRDGEPWLAALVVVGELGGDTYLLPVEPGVVIVVDGPQAPTCVAAMEAVASAWEWTGGRLVVTADPHVVREEARLMGNPEETVERIRVLYFGDPEQLEDDDRRRVGTVTIGSAEAGDVHLHCDQSGTRIEPYGLLLSSSALSPEAAATAAELLRESEVGPVTPTEPAEQPDPVPAGSELAETVPGAVEVRLLAPVPRVTGAEGPVPANRADRALELLAYLALAGGPVPADEARTEALSTGGHEGSVHTLRLVASTLRRWIGPDHIPNATRAGYEVRGITTDLGRLRLAVSLAMTTGDDQKRVDLLRPALELIEGRPLSRVTMGWGWWTAVYESQARDAACDAACILAPILADAGDGRGAAWAINQARIVDPWSEVLYRTAILCAGQTRNAGWVVREMRACESMIDDLVPGASPSAATVEAYHYALDLSAA
jgi:hypothetical protein